MASHVLFACWARREEKRGWPALALFTFVGSVRTGWHYALDGYVGALLALLAVAIAIRIGDADEGGTVGAASCDR